MKTLTKAHSRALLSTFSSASAETYIPPLQRGKEGLTNQMEANWTSEWARGEAKCERGRCAKTSLSSQQESEIDISCLCKAWISTVFWAWKVCLPVMFQFLVSYGNWDFLFLYLLQQFLPRQFLNVRSVHVLCEGNASEWWERIIAIYSLENTTASLLSLPVLSQDVECVTEWMCQEKGEGVVKFFASLGG